MIKKTAKFVPYIVLGLIFIMLLMLNVFYQDHWLDSDMAAEMMFSKLLAEGNHVFATNEWYYSTEFRFLYTHLIMAPLFRIMDNWHIIRTITNIVFYVLMYVSYLYAVKPLGLRKTYKVLLGAVLFLPFSETMALHMQIGNTYMSHVIILFFFFGLFLRLAGTENDSGAKRIIMLICYLALALVCGISGIRYLFTMQCPLVVTALLFSMKSEEFQAFRREMTFAGFGKVCKSKEVRYLLYSLLGAVGAVVGYGINVIWISRQYVFQTYGATNFISVYQGVLFERLQNAIGTLLGLFGYIPDKGVLSLRGLITVIAFVMLGIFIYCTAKAFKRAEGVRGFLVLFVIVAFIINVFVFVFTTSTMVPRYYITIMIFVLPVLAIYLEEEAFAFDRFAVIMLLIGCFSLSTAKTVYSVITVDKNADKREVAAFLAENNYDFGYAAYTNGNILTELTNGKIEVANIGDPEYLEYFKWSSPMKYYEEDYSDDEVFLLLTDAEAKTFYYAESVQKGQKVYEDGKYVVFLYDSTEQLMSYANSR